MPALSVTVRTGPFISIAVCAMRERMLVDWTTSVALNVLLPVETTVTEDVSLLDAVKAPLYPVSCTVNGCVKYDDGQPDGSCGNDKVVIVPY